ncbi:histone-lysine N-methyltransferase SETMAR [Trichonephila clavipes]|nr:histone-lysine N-methyltransferase SETMAR [Trichonephila clavipes]
MPLGIMPYHTVKLQGWVGKFQQRRVSNSDEQRGAANAEADGIQRFSHRCGDSSRKLHRGYLGSEFPYFGNSKTYYEGISKSQDTPYARGKEKFWRASWQHRTEEAIRALGHYLGGKSFHDDDEIKDEVEMWFRQQEATFYDCGVEKPVHRLIKCWENEGDHVEK